MTDAFQDDGSIAVIGLAGRFPGARDVDEFWDNLKAGREAVSFPTDAELAAAGVPGELLARANYVKATMKLEGTDLFDAEFFAYSPKQAESIDPQHRVFLECAWASLENAGYDVEAFRKPIGVFAGSGVNSYLLSALHRLVGSRNSVDRFQTRIDSDKDFLTTRVSYKLNLTGPSVVVQAGCSTSLVAVHLACQSLLNYECDIALAGGVSLQIPHGQGYLYHEGGTASPDGHCRAFDANAKGTVFGSGVAIVVLRRLAEALAEGDSIHAVIRGSAVNNDGSHKVGYTAPGLHGQSRVIAAALSVAGVQPRDVGFVEAHGTGTVLGDAVELGALTQVYRARSNDRKFCALGSLKTNIGHLDAAAGVAGLIKSILCLKHKTLVPSLNFQTPNEILGAPDSPFYVNTETRAWTCARGRRHAGVSSFGIGGTNAHVILEEAPDRHCAPEREEEDQIFPISARSGSALAAAQRHLAASLRSETAHRLEDIAYTLQVGRKRFNHRSIAVARGREQLIETLEQGRELTQFASNEPDNPGSVVFMFSGHGCQYPGMASAMYRSDRHFRGEMDRCAELVARRSGVDILQWACREPSAQMQDGEDVIVAQLALFVVEYCLADLWINWGISPDAVVGHSTGEYAAACVAGIFSLDDAIELVASRARAMALMPPGAMMAIRLAEGEVRELIDPSLSLAAVNGPSQCVVAGPVDKIEELSAGLALRGIECRRLAMSRAYHSPAAAPVARVVLEAASRMTLNAPKLPYVSSVTGRWVSADEIASPAYWGAHVQNTVRFSSALRQLTEGEKQILIEVGPGESLLRMARQQTGDAKPFRMFASLADGAINDRSRLLHTLGELWLGGAAVNWHRFHAGRPCRRVPLPTYPFEGQRYWIAHAGSTANQETSAAAERLPLEHWFYVPSWKTSLGPRAAVCSADAPTRWLVFVDDTGFGESLVSRLKAIGHDATSVVMGEAYAETDGDRIVIDPRSPADYRRLLSALEHRGERLQNVVHCWSLSKQRSRDSVRCFDEAQDRGYLSVLYFVKAAAELDGTRTRSLRIVTDRLFAVSGEENVCAEKAPLAALCKIVPQEFANFQCAVIDIGGDGKSRTAGRPDRADWIIAETLQEPDEPAIAYRGRCRLVQEFEPVRIGETGRALRDLRRGGVYLIAGGLGRIGLGLADRLAKDYRARLLLISRKFFPEPSVWDAWLAEHEPAEPISVQIRRLQAIEAAGGSVLVLKADVSDEAEVRRALGEGEGRFGAVNGVFHLAVETFHPSVRRPLSALDRNDFAIQVRPKVYGFYVLDKILRARALDFGVLFSSNASTLGGAGFGAYAAANAFLDHVVADQRHARKFDWLTINWDGWLASNIAISEHDRSRGNIDPYAMTAAEAVEALRRVIVSSTVRQVVVSTTKFEKRFDTWVRRRGARALSLPENDAPAEAARKKLTDHNLPRTDLERAIANIWEEVLGRHGIGVDDSFLDLGGDSLIGLRVLVRIQERFHVEIPLRVIIGSGQTLATLAVEIVARMAAQHDADIVAEQIESIAAM
jgi:phthiocerol/phenolphthiocerol synthesis type-I polyketide synthase E